MIRTLTVAAAAFALLLPAGRYIDDALGTGVKSGSASASETRPFADGLVLATHAGGEVVPGDYAKAKANGIIAILIG